MTRGRHQHIIHDYRQQLARREKQAEQQLETAYQHVLRTISPALDKLYNQMVEALANGQKIPAHWLYEANRLESIKKLIQNEIDHFGQLSQMQVGQIQHWAAALGQKSAMEMLQATVPEGVHWTFGRPSPEAIANIVGATQRGSPLADLFDGFGREAAQKAGEALISGVALGKNPREIAPLVSRALGISRARALTISRDSLNNAYRDANLETFRANDDVVESWVWVCDLSIRTCAVCIAMNGTVHPLSEDFIGHPNDRCTPVPQTRSWESILSPLGIDTSDIPETSIDVPSGADWFDNQDEKTQRAILGNAAFAAYQDGAITLHDLVGTSYSKDWGSSRYQKSLKAAIGTKKAQKYYAGAKS